MADISADLIIATPLLHTFIGHATNYHLLYICTYIGSLPNEFDVLTKYFNHLAELPPNKFDYSIFVKAKIITDKDKDFISRRNCGFQIVLIKTLNHLLGGDTNSFYQLLGNLKYIPNGDEVTFRMQTEIKLLTGMYTYA